MVSIKINVLGQILSVQSIGIHSELGFNRSTTVSYSSINTKDNLYRDLGISSPLGLGIKLKLSSKSSLLLSPGISIDKFEVKYQRVSGKLLFSHRAYSGSLPIQILFADRFSTNGKFGYVVGFGAVMHLQGEHSSSATKWRDIAIIQELAEYTIVDKATILNANELILGLKGSTGISYSVGRRGGKNPDSVDILITVNYTAKFNTTLLGSLSLLHEDNSNLDEGYGYKSNGSFVSLGVSIFKSL